MLQTAVTSVTTANSQLAGEMLATQIEQQLDNTPEAIILFSAPQYDHQTLVATLHQNFPSALLVGCSSAGEFTHEMQGEGACCAIALTATEHEMHFSTAIGRNLKTQRNDAAFSLSTTLQMSPCLHYPHHAALILADGLAGHLEEFLAQLSQLSPDTCEFFGGGAGDNAQFLKTPVFYNDEVVEDAVVMLSIDSYRPIGIGAAHGWAPASDYLLVTKADNFHLIEIDGKPAVEIFEKHAAEHKKSFDRQAPLPFFLHTLIGMPSTGYRLRVPLVVEPDGSIICAAEVPEGSMITLMHSTTTSPIIAAERAANLAQNRLYGCKPAVSIFFDCVASRLSMGDDSFRRELQTLEKAIGDIPYGGCNTHGQIVRAQAQFSGFHNCTAVVALLPSS